MKGCSMQRDLTKKHIYVKESLILNLILVITNSKFANTLFNPKGFGL